MHLSAVVAAYVRSHSVAAVGTLAAVELLMLVWIVALRARLGRLDRVYKRLTRGTSGGNLEQRLEEFASTAERAAHHTETVEQRVAALEMGQRRCLQRIGMVRFDAFDEVGGEQSFAVVVTDEQQNGFALSSVYSRADVRVYAKQIREGTPSHPLTAEERRALAQAEGR